MNVPHRDPQMVAWETLRERGYSPSAAARAGDLVVGALLALFDFVPKTHSCGTNCSAGPEVEYDRPGRILTAVEIDAFSEEMNSLDSFEKAMRELDGTEGSE